MTSVRRALALSFLERYLSVALALASNMLLARLLTPHEIGLYSVSLAVIGIAQVLRDFGIGNYLIQEPHLTDDHVRTAFGLSLLLGGGLAAAVFLLAPLAAGFYGEPAMVQTMRIAALNFLVLPFCTVRLALLRRRLRFKALLYVSLAAAVLSQGVTVALAWAGLGADSMAIGSVVLNAATAVGTYVADGDRRWLAPSLTMWRPLLRFGGQSALTNVVTTVSMDANDLVVGKVLGLGPVAMLSRAQGLMNLFHRDVMGAVRNVALPALAQAHREGTPLVPALTKAVSLVTLAAWPFYVLVSVFALEVLRFLFGPQWDEAATLVPAFCLAGVLSAITSLVSSAALAVGRIDLVTRSELILQPMKLVLMAATAILTRDLHAVALAFAFTAVVSTPVFLAVSERAVRGSGRALLSACLPSLWVTLPLSMPALLVAQAYGFDRSTPIPLAVVVLTLAACVALGILAAEWFRHPVTHEAAYARARAWILGPKVEAKP